MQSLVNQHIDADRLLSLITAIPPVGVIADPVMYTRLYEGLPDEYTNLMFAGLECTLFSGRCVYGGMIKLDGWGMGRPAKRRKRMRAPAVKALDRGFSLASLVELERLIDNVALVDPQRESLWFFAIHVVDPITQTHESDDTASHHLCLLYISGSTATLFDPLGVRSPVRTITQTALHTLVGTGGITAYNILDFPVQRIDEHQCVLWCGWLASYVCKYGPAHGLKITERSTELDEFVALARRGITGALLTLYSRTSPSF